MKYQALNIAYNDDVIENYATCGDGQYKNV
jgi:hypothetical protein